MCAIIFWIHHYPLSLFSLLVEFIFSSNYMFHIIFPFDPSFPLPPPLYIHYINYWFLSFLVWVFLIPSHLEWSYWVWFFQLFLLFLSICVFSRTICVQPFYEFISIICHYFSFLWNLLFSSRYSFYIIFPFEPSFPLPPSLYILYISYWFLS